MPVATSLTACLLPSSRHHSVATSLLLYPSKSPLSGAAQLGPDRPHYFLPGLYALYLKNIIFNVNLVNFLLVKFVLTISHIYMMCSDYC